MTVGIRTSAGREPAALPAGEVLEALYVGVSAILLLQLGFVYLPFMNALFGSALLGAGA